MGMTIDRFGGVNKHVINTYSLARNDVAINLLQDHVLFGDSFSLLEYGASDADLVGLIPMM